MKIRISFLIALMLPALAQGAVTSTVVFETSSQGMWGSGTTAEILFNEFYGVEWNESGSVGINAGIGSATVSGSTAGKVGVDVDFSFDAGTVDAVVPFEAGLNFSYANFVEDQYVTLYTVGNLQTANSLLKTSFPSLSLSADLVVDLYADIQASGCVDVWVYEGCGSTGKQVLIDTGEQRMELLALNRIDDVTGIPDGEVRLVPALQELLGAAEDVTEALVDAAETANDIREELEQKNPDGTPKYKTKTEKTKVVLKELLTPDVGFESEDILSLDVRLPVIETTGTSDGSVLTAQGSDNFLDLEIDVDALATSVGLLPPLSVDLNISAGAGIADANVKATLADINLTPSLSIDQQFTLTPELVMDLAFDRAVTAMVDGVLYENTTTLTGLRAGVDSFDLLWDNLDVNNESRGPLQITPTYRLTAMLNNQTDLGLDLNLNVQALSASASVSVAGYNLGSAGFGPIFNEDLDLTDAIGNPRVNIFSEEFELQGFQNSIVGQALTLDTSGAIFTGEGGNYWSDPNNWSTDQAPTSGTDVVIDSQNMPNGFKSAWLQNGNGADVGNVTIGVDSTVYINGTLNQLDGINTKGFSNTGTVIAQGIPGVPGWDGTLGIAAPVSGGGVILLLDGTVNASTAAGLDLQGQLILGSGVINARNKLSIDANSAIGVGDGTLNLNITDNTADTVNRGTIVATNGGTLNWTANSRDQYYLIDNRSGRIEASDGGTVQIGRTDTRKFDCGFFCDELGSIRVHGGTLATDADSQIRFTRNLMLSNAPRIDGNVFAGSVELRAGGLINDGFFSFGGAEIQDEQDVLVSGNGIAQFNGEIRAEDVPYSTGERATLTNGEHHTFRGQGSINSNITLVNHGTIDANGTNSLTISSSTTNDGTLSATGAGGLIINRTLNTGQGRVTANGGNVTINATLVGGSTTGPGGVWTAANGNTIALENGVQQWNSLKSGVLDGGEIVLQGNGSDFTVDGASLSDTLLRIGTAGKLKLVNHLFNRADFAPSRSAKSSSMAC